MNKKGRKIFAIVAATLLLGASILGPISTSGNMLGFWIGLGILLALMIGAIVFVLWPRKKKDGNVAES